MIRDSQKFLKNKNLNDILSSQILATQKVFKLKKIPFRSFLIKNKKEETLGELFSFFIIENILLAKALKINPYDQPSVELIKNQTIKNLLNS
jgi:glucose-6-phosphate isomerase